MKKTIFTLALLLFTSIAWGQSAVGQWKTIDDDSGKAKSIVEIYEKNGKLYGKIVKLLNQEPGEDPDPICDKCSSKDDRHNQKVIGMEIMRDMEKDGEEWEDGKILDPENGEVYKCKIWLNEDDSDQLMVRGYVAFFYRTQSWYRVK